MAGLTFVIYGFNGASEVRYLLVKRIGSGSSCVTATDLWFDVVHLGY